jgi:hypothetical protein
MSTNEQCSPDVIGKVFIVRRHGLRECLVCGESFTQQTAPHHAEVNCYEAVEFCLMEPCQGGHDVT